MATPRPSTFEQRNLLHQLGIELSEPWVWITSDDPVTDAPTCWHVDAGDTKLHIPLTEAERKRWCGYGYVAIGIRLDHLYARMYAELYGLTVGPRGLLQQWANDLYVGVHYQRVTIAGSPLYAEVTAVPRRDAAIRYAHVEHQAGARKAAWRAMDHLLVGPAPGRPRRPRKGSAAADWVTRVDVIGEPAARAEYYARVPRGPGRYAWWDDNILRTIRRRKHRQK